MYYKHNIRPLLLIPPLLFIGFLLYAIVFLPDLNRKLTEDYYSQPLVSVSSPSGRGSGVAVGPHTVLTALHVVGDANSVGLVDYKGDKHTGTVLSIGRHPDIDVAVIQTESRLPNYVEFSCEVPKQGSRVVISGNPMSVSKMVTRGFVGQNHTARNKPVPLDVSVGPGNSGGPVFHDGKVVGILVSAIVSGRIGFFGVSFMVSGETICNSFDVVKRR